jgi:murein DD-endopeptidase MepM/ murein hydrolase activator NlpD
MTKISLIIYASCLLSLASCKSGTVNLFKASSPHEQYLRKLTTVGLDKTAMGNAWINNSTSSLQKAVVITLPYKETGYFSADRIPAAAYRFTATRGQKVKINLVKKPEFDFMVYIDLWRESIDGQPKLIASADTLGNAISIDVDETSTYLIRLQPELLRGGEYTLEINTLASLGFPVKTSATIQSFFGDGRDANSRKHEGIDIFAPFRTPVQAIASGTITRVNENNLGGKVVWMRPSGKDYTLYYAHLDLQIATEGQQVNIGDTLGLIGNTGNARTTAPHLHFGIYTSSGAVDPLPFVDKTVKPFPNITTALSALNSTMRSNSNTTLYQSNRTNSTVVSSIKKGTVLHIDASNTSWYKAELPDGTVGFIQGKAVTSTSKALRQVRIKPKQIQVFDQPDSLAAVKLNLQPNTLVNLLGSFNNYQLISGPDQQTGWIKMD